jgi:K+-sensing histidine kinase KdpD
MSTQTQSVPVAHAPRMTDARLQVVRDALLAISAGEWEKAAAALEREPQIAARDAVCLNLWGIVWQGRGQWRKAGQCYGKAKSVRPGYGPAEQNVRRIYELNTFGRTRLPVALTDFATMAQVRQLPNASAEDQSILDGMSPWLRADATMDAVKRSWDWRGYSWALLSVALATAIGWPLVHWPRLHLADTNVLMLYLLAVLWVATRYSRGAAVLASVLGVAVFDFVFVRPYYTFAVADQQYVVTFAVMLLTALVISTLTHRARQQSELARQAWERVETEFLRNTLLSGVSHELRTPLAAIAGAASSLAQTNSALNQQTRDDLLQIICSESDRMERLVNNLLDMTRLEAGGLVVKREWLPLQEVIGSALHHLERRLGDRPVKILLPSPAPMIHVDGVLIEQVLTNLIDNVIEYTPQDSAIEVTAQALDGQIQISVSDRGPGLPAGTETRVFEKFFRIHQGESRRGIGLGLAIVRGIIEAHGGRVSAANREGGGAIFGFALPLTGSPPALDSSG